MRRPRHAAEDGSFGRSAGMAAGRGAVLLAIAVILGVVLLNAADDPPPERVSAGTSEEDDDGEESSTDSTISTTTVVTVPVRAPQDVKVLPTNGTTVKGVAGKARDLLQAAGYNVLAPTDAQKANSTNVYFTTPDYEREAQAVAAVLGLPTTVVAQFPNAPPLPVADGRGASVIVVVGPEAAEQLSARSPSTSSTTSGSTTTTTR